MSHFASTPATARLRAARARAARSAAATADGWVGWVPFLCVVAAILLLATSAISWVTAPNWGLHNALAPARSIGVVTVAPPQKIKQSQVAAPVVSVAPFSISIPALKVGAPIVDIGTTADKELEPPLPPTTVGWWKYGAKPGAATGTAVIAGHINYAGVDGAFAQIGRLNPGDKVVVRGTRAGKKTSLTFSIIGVRTYSKKTLPWQEIFNQNVPGRLALVTCGGSFDSATGNYLANIVAYAMLDNADSGDASGSGSHAGAKHSKSPAKTG